jgi:hypothetical protein
MSAEDVYQGVKALGIGPEISAITETEAFNDL